MLWAIESVTYIDAPADADGQDLAAQFDQGLEQAVKHFPGGEVVKATVKLIRAVESGEAAEEGLTE